jgi:MSHA biogenesis protein MshI
MAFITQLKNKITALFSTVKSSDLIGVSLCQQHLSFCYIPQEGDATYERIKLNNILPNTILSTLAEKYKLAGQCQYILAAVQYQIVQIDKPKVPEAEIAAALKWQMKELVTIAPEDMILDYFDGPYLVGGQKLNVVCASKKTLKTVVETLVDSPININTISIEEFAFTHLLPVQEEACLLICQQPNEEIIILIVKKGQLFFHRRLRGFSGIGKQSEEKLQMGVIDTLSLEIQRSTDFFERQLKQSPIKSIQLIVPITAEAFLAEKLAENTNVPVSLLALPEGHEHHRTSAVVIGAALLNQQEKS